MKMYEITETERQQLIDLLVEQKDYSPDSDLFYEALLILGYDLEEEEAKAKEAEEEYYFDE